MTKIIEDQKASLVNFVPDIALPEISLAFRVRESTYEKLEKVFLKSCNIVTETLILDENKEVRDFSAILDKTQIWVCPACNRIMRNDNIFCEQCQIFKPLEMCQNILHKPMLATPDEI